MRLQILSSKKPFLKNSENFRQSIIGVPCYYDILSDNFSKINIQVDVLDFEDIDKSKPWIVDVLIQAWKLYNFDGDILDCFNDNIKKELLEGSAYLLLNHAAESHTAIFFKHLYRLLQHTKLPTNKIIYLSNAYRLDDHYNDFVKSNNIEDKDRIFTMFSPHGFNYINQQDVRFFEYDRTKPKSKAYLFLNRVDRDHRIMMTSMLSYYDLLQYGYVSLGSKPDVKCEFLDTDYRLRQGFDKIKNDLPLIVDTTDFEYNHVGYQSLSMKFYEETYFSLVSSTFALDEQEVAVATNEKELKPMLAKQPFVVFGRPKTLEYMRDMGFMTFSKWFDESYDTELDNIKRMERIALEVKRLSSLTTTEWQRILHEMEPILIHNHSRLVNYLSERCYFSSDLKKFLLYVA